MLQLENLSISLGGKKILSSVNARAKEGEFILLLGENGSGKSTLFDLISGRKRAQTGKIFLGQIDVTKRRESKRAFQIGRLFQNPLEGSLSSLTVRENIAMAATKGRRAWMRPLGHTFPEEELVTLAEEIGFDFTKLLNCQMGQLSGGQRQIVNFLMVIITKPSLLLLDEPTAALDPEARREFYQFLKRFLARHPITTLMITHDPEAIDKLGTKRWVLKDQTLIA